MFATKNVLIMLCAVIIAGHQAEAIHFVGCLYPEQVGEFLYADVTGCKDESAVDCAINEYDNVEVSFTFNSGPGYQNATYSVIAEYGHGHSAVLVQDNACNKPGFKCPGESNLVQTIEFEFTPVFKIDDYVYRTGSVWLTVTSDTNSKPGLACVGFKVEVDYPKSLRALIVGSSN